MAASSSPYLSTIVTPTSSSSLLPSDNSLTHFSPFPFPKKSSNPFKPLTLKSQNYPLSPALPVLFPIHHFCRCSAGFDDAQETFLDENPDDIEQEQSEEDVVDGFDDDDYDEDEDNEEIKGSNSVDDCRLFVGNLPYSMTSSQLSDAFAEAGQVKFVEIIYDKVTDRSRGFGFVTMGSVDEAKEAIRMFDGSQMGGRTVKVNFPEVPKGGERKVMGPIVRRSYQSFVDSPHKIYAGNLAWVVSTQRLREAFGNQPGFLSAKVVFERDSGRSRGFGFITFSSAEAAEGALNSMNGVELEGRPLRLNMAASGARSNTRAYDEGSEVLSSVSS